MCKIALPYEYNCETSRLRSCHLDYFSLGSSKSPKGKTAPSSRNYFRHSYFYRSHLTWNLLPLSLRQSQRPSVFKIKLIDYIWKELINISQLLNPVFSDNEISDSEEISLSHLILSQIFFLNNY